MGGVARRATAIQDYRSKDPALPVLVVETGNALKQSDLPDDPVNRWVVLALDTMGVDAVNATAAEIQRFARLGAAGSLRELRLDCLATAPEPPQNGGSVFKPYTIRTVRSSDGSKSVKVGVMGLSAPAGGSSVVWEDALKRRLPDVERASDIVVLLAWLPPEQLAEIARKFPGIDVIVNGSSTGEGREYARTGRTVIVESAHEGVALGTLHVEWDSQGRVTSYRNQLIPLPPMVPDHGAVAGVVAKARRESAAAAEAEARKAPVPAQPSLYAGAKECKVCHEKAYAAWERSAHSRAIDPLVKSSNQYNPECLPCHVTGFNTNRGFVNVVRTPELAKVQCEYCHGPARDHAARPQEIHPGIGPYQQIRRKVRPQVCAHCHTADNSPSFDFEAYWKKIQH